MILHVHVANLIIVQLASFRLEDDVGELGEVITPGADQLLGGELDVAYQSAAGSRLIGKAPVSRSLKQFITRNQSMAFVTDK